jgi:RNA-directed DNA polymerase
MVQAANRKIRWTRTPRSDQCWPGAFDLLGFTFYWGRPRKGAPLPKVKTSGKLMRAKLKAVNNWSRAIRSRQTLRTIWADFCAKLRGHIQYYGVSFNVRAVHTFLVKATRIRTNGLIGAVSDDRSTGSSLPCSSRLIRCLGRGSVMHSISLTMWQRE